MVGLWSRRRASGTLGPGSAEYPLVESTVWYVETPGAQKRAWKLAREVGTTEIFGEAFCCTCVARFFFDTVVVFFVAVLQHLLDLSCTHIVLDIGDIGSTGFRFCYGLCCNKIPAVFRISGHNLHLSQDLLAGGWRPFGECPWFFTSVGWNLEIPRRPAAGFGGGMSQVEPFISHPNICPTFLRFFTTIGRYNLLRLKKMGTNRLRRFVLSRHILDFNRKRGTWIFMKLEIEPQVEVVGRNSMAMFATSTRYNLIGIRSLVLTDFGGPHRLGVSRSA